MFLFLLLSLLIFPHFFFIFVVSPSWFVADKNTMDKREMKDREGKANKDEENKDMRAGKGKTRRIERKGLGNG